MQAKSKSKSKARGKKTSSAIAIMDKWGEKNDPGYRAGLEEAQIIMETAEAFYNARKEAGLTQTELAKLAGTTQSVISDIEDGDSRGRSLATLTKIAVALGINLKLSINPRKSDAVRVITCKSRVKLSG